MPTSKETRVRVEGFWKIIPSVRPGRRWCRSRSCWRRLSSSARSRTSVSSSVLQSATFVNERPLRRSATATAILGGSYSGNTCQSKTQVLSCSYDQITERRRWDGNSGSLGTVPRDRDAAERDEPFHERPPRGQRSHQSGLGACARRLGDGERDRLRARRSRHPRGQDLGGAGRRRAVYL